MNQFDKVNCSRGAPMGRHEFGHVNEVAGKSIALFRVRLQGDYDDGGAYWGCESRGEKLYCARSEVFCKFTRAPDRLQAMKNFGLQNLHLKRAGI